MTDTLLKKLKGIAVSSGIIIGTSIFVQPSEITREVPTITDCHVVLGHINPDYFLGGAMRLDPAAARSASCSLKFSMSG